MLPVRSHDHHAAVWAYRAEYERRLHSLLEALLEALPKNVAHAFGQFIHFTKAIGYEVPAGLVLRADKVIE